MPDEKARAAQLEQDDRWLKSLHRIDPAKLSPNLRADWAILANAFEADRWALTELRSWQWNPSNYNVADPFALLASLEYAPLEQRLRTILARLPNVPAYYAAAKRSVANLRASMSELAIEQNRGALDVFGPTSSSQVATANLTSAERESFSRGLAAGARGDQDYVNWLAELDARFVSGAELRDRFASAASSMAASSSSRSSPARRPSGSTRARSRRRSGCSRGWRCSRICSGPKYFPNAAPPDDRFERVGRLIAKLSERHVPPEQLVAAVKRQIPELEQWVRDHDLLDLDASKPLAVRETPLYKRGIAGASIDSPGPYDPGAPTYYNVTPLDDLSPERAESWLREYNDWMLPILNIHEAVPGHYVQLVYANRSPSLIKSIFGNGAMIEGWAVYTERMMLESGYGDDKAEFWLIYSKWNLRSRLKHDPRLRRARARHERGGCARPARAAGVPDTAGSGRQMEARPAHERAAHELLLRLRRDLRLARALQARARRRVRLEALPRAILELRERAGRRDPRAHGATGAALRAAFAPTLPPKDQYQRLVPMLM